MPRRGRCVSRRRAPGIPSLAAHPLRKQVPPTSLARLILGLGPRLLRRQNSSPARPPRVPRASPALTARAPVARIRPSPSSSPGRAATVSSSPSGTRAHRRPTARGAGQGAQAVRRGCGPCAREKRCSRIGGPGPHPQTASAGGRRVAPGWRPAGLRGPPRGCEGVGPAALTSFTPYISRESTGRSDFEERSRARRARETPGRSAGVGGWVGGEVVGGFTGPPAPDSSVSDGLQGLPGSP